MWASSSGQYFSSRESTSSDIDVESVCALKPNWKDVENLPESEAISQVLLAERQFLLAHLNCDVAALDHLMADEYAQIDSKGSIVPKSEVIASFESGTRHWDEAHSDEFRVRLYGETAVVIGRWQARGVNAGQAFDYAARYLSVWVWRDDRWQMVNRPIHRYLVAHSRGLSSARRSQDRLTSKATRCFAAAQYGNPTHSPL